MTNAYCRIVPPPVRRVYFKQYATPVQLEAPKSHATREPTRPAETQRESPACPSNWIMCLGGFAAVSLRQWPLRRGDVADRAEAVPGGAQGKGPGRAGTRLQPAYFVPCGPALSTRVALGWGFRWGSSSNRRRWSSGL
jgi:hypothetical protein